MGDIDDFITEKVPHDFHEAVAMVRGLMAECAPESTEKISYGMLMWAGRWPLAWINPAKKGITFGFRAGAYFDDPYGLLKGTGKHARHVKLTTVEGANLEALRHYVKQAVDDDSGPPAEPA